MSDYWDEISQDLYEKGYMDRYAPPPGTPPGVATGYICCKVKETEQEKK